MSLRFYLMTETAFHASYLVTEWLNKFGKAPEFQGIIVRESFDAAKHAARENFHDTYATMNLLSAQGQRLLQTAYPDLSQAEEAMIARFSVPRYAATHHAKTNFIGENLNSSTAQAWLSATCATGEIPYFFIFLDQVLQPWWIKQAPHHIINAHSAVLPYARGMHAIENIAALHDVALFRQAAGATVHFINDGIDTGPIIASHTFPEPFTYDSIWDLKGNTYDKAFTLLTNLAEYLSCNPSEMIAGKRQDPDLLGPCFRSKDFTANVQSQAEEGYAMMKADEAARSVYETDVSVC